MDLVICRVCRQFSDDLLSIDDLLHEESKLTILESISVCSGSEISKSDGLPYFICDFCLDELKITYIFLQKLQESTEILTNELKLNPHIKAEVLADFKEESSRKTESPEIANSESQDPQEQIYTFVFDEDNESPQKSESEELNVEEEETQNYEEVDVEEGYLEEETLLEEYQVEYNDEPDFSSGVFEELEIATEEEVNLSGKTIDKTAIIEEGTFVKNVRGGYLLRLEDDTLVYQCDSCEKTFKKPDYLSNHVRFVHKKVRPYACSVCCEFLWNLNLKQIFILISYSEYIHIQSAAQGTLQISYGRETF